MKNRAMFLALAAGGVFASVATAEETREIRFGGLLPALTLNADGTVSSATPFQTNAIQNVWDNTGSAFGTASSFTLGNTVHVLDDFNFTPGGWSATAPSPVTGRAITNITFAVGSVGTAPATFDVVLRFWRQSDASYTATPSMITGTTPLQEIRVAFTNLNNGFIYLQPLALTTPIVVPDGDAQVFVEAGAYVTGTNTLMPNVTQTGTVWGTTNGFNGPSVGSTSTSWGRDRNNDGIFTGAPAPAAAPAEHNATLATGGSPPSSRPITYAMQMRGDVPPPAPPAGRINLGCDGAVAVTTQPDDSVRFYEICLTGAADDASLQFLNIDTEGSVGDVDMALYDAASGDIAGQAAIDGVDRNDGTGENAQLTFGVGRRAAIDDTGKDYDGRDGQLAAGTYILAVGPAGTTFAPGYVVTAGTPSGAGYTLNVSANTGGTALPASQAPSVTLLNDFSSSPYGFGADTLHNTTVLDLGVRDVKWSKFATSAAAAAADNTYLDINFNHATSTATADGVAYVFDSSGNEVAFSDDTGVAPNVSGLPQFSFGATAPARTRGTNPTAFAGEDGDLPAGTYYVAHALFATQDITGAPGGERWHVRGTSGSALDVNAEFYTGVGITCDSIDFNNDGLFPDDSDLVDFLSVLAGGVCSNDPNCNDIDFNNDGLFPDDNDLVAYLSVLAGGPC